MEENKNNDNTTPQSVQPPQNPQQPLNEKTASTDNTVSNEAIPSSAYPAQQNTTVMPPSNTMVNPNNTSSMPPTKKSKGWKIFFILLAVANVITIVFPLVTLVWLIGQANSGVPGTEYIGFALLPLLFAGVIIAIVNVVSIIFYTYRHRPKRLLIWIGVLVCLLSLSYLGKFGIPVYRSYFELKSYRETGGQEATITKQEAIAAINSCKLIELKQLQGTPPRLVIKADGKQPPLGDVKYAENKDWNDLKTTVENAPATCSYDETTVLEENTVRPLLPITVERAIELINSCKTGYKGLDFYYDYIYVSGTTFGNKISKDIVESSSTGILLAFSTTYGTPESVHVAARNVDKLLPIAREAQKSCKYNFLIRYGDALHGNDKVEGEPSYMRNYNNQVTN